MKADLSLNVFWQGTSKPLLRVDLSSFMFRTLWTVLCICVCVCVCVCVFYVHKRARDIEEGHKLYAQEENTVANCT